MEEDYADKEAMKLALFRIGLFVVAVIMLAPKLRAQTDPLAKWKPNVGDKFICSVSHFSDCGDWKCEGIDTLLFEIIDTSYNADLQHQNSVLASTRVIALHYTNYTWGQNGYNPSLITNWYPDTTFMAMTQPKFLETSFIGGGSSAWTQIPLVQDSSVIFQGISYSDFSGFSPQLGWFFSLGGYGGYCTPICIEETWNMSLIAAIKGSGVVQSAGNLTPLLFLDHGSLHVVNVDANQFILTDLVGRPIRSWELPNASKPRDITLNVADLPSGVYFLRISGGGIDEVKKVCIVH